MVHVTNIDGITTVQEVADGIARQLEIDNTDVKVYSLRHSYICNQKATVELEEKWADKLVKTRWVKGKVIPRVDVKKCYECLEYCHERGTARDSIERKTVDVVETRDIRQVLAPKL